MIEIANPLSFCGRYKIEVAGAKSQESLGCYDGIRGSCFSRDEILRPSESHTDRILLNRSQIFVDLAHIRCT